MAEIQSREPELFSAGDTLLFAKYLPKYLPSDGWSVEYQLTDEGGVLRATALSTADNDMHKVLEDDFAASCDAGDYILTGYAIKDAERHQIYYGELTLTPDFASGSAQPPQKTEAQEMIETIRASLKDLYSSPLEETDVQGSRFRMAKAESLRNELAFWKEVRNNEIQQARARAGLPPGNVITPIFNIG